MRSSSDSYCALWLTGTSILYTNLKLILTGSLLYSRKANYASCGFGSGRIYWLLITALWVLTVFQSGTGNGASKLVIITVPVPVQRKMYDACEFFPTIDFGMYR
jgi:hypothetical protein